MQTSTWAPAVSDRIEAVWQAEIPLPQSAEAMSSPPFRAIHADVLKGMISYRIGFSECAHGRASATASTPGSRCLPSLVRLAKSKIQTRSRTALAANLGRKWLGNFFGWFRHTRAASLVLAAGGSHAASDSSNSRDTHPH